MIRVQNVTFRYGRGEAVLRDVSLDVHAGELIAIVGPNGSGKSTLVSLLDGLNVPELGTVTLDGLSIASYPRREIARTVGYVAQTVDLHFPLTTLEYVLQGRFAHGHLLGFETDGDLAAAHHAMDMTEIEALAARHLDELSGGERQRVMLARAVAQEPRALLLDEPTSNLDIAHQVRMLDLMRGLAHDTGMAVVVVTHELNLAAEFADRILLLERGQVRGFGRPSDVLQKDVLEQLFRTPVMVDGNPVSGAPRVTVVAPPGKRELRDEPARDAELRLVTNPAQ